MAIGKWISFGTSQAASAPAPVVSPQAPIVSAADAKLFGLENVCTTLLCLLLALIIFSLAILGESARPTFVPRLQSVPACVVFLAFHPILVRNFRVFLATLPDVSSGIPSLLKPILSCTCASTYTPSLSVVRLKTHHTANHRRCWFKERATSAYSSSQHLMGRPVASIPPCASAWIPRVSACAIRSPPTRACHSCYQCPPRASLVVLQALSSQLQSAAARRFRPP